MASWWYQQYVYAKNIFFKCRKVDPTKHSLLWLTIVINTGRKCIFDVVLMKFFFVSGQAESLCQVAAVEGVQQQSAREP